MNAKALELEALNLSSTERAKLALDLIESLETLTPQEVILLWERESARRAEQIDNGEVAMISSDIVALRTHDLLG
ncbi:MAG: addiction module protein [Pseudomonadota bacterium]|nr:addiction module protein [Pseudomonadota bacterium]